MHNRETLLLFPDRPLRLDAARHAELCVETGTVWITVSGMAGDLFLAAGERYRVPQDGMVLVEAVRGTAAARLEGSRRRLIPILVESLRVLLPKGMALP